MTDPQTTTEVVESFRELVYDREAWEFIKERWPEAKFTNASDYIHEGRFGVEIVGITSDDFYPLMLVEGWARCCLGFEMATMMKEKVDDVWRWISMAKALESGDGDA